MDLLAAMRMFRMVAEGYSLSEAGRQSGQMASTVSRQIQALEVHLGVRLMQRTTREVQLTELGAEYLDRDGSRFPTDAVHFGAKRWPPSRRSTEPFIIGFSKIARAMCAYSSGRPMRFGKAASLMRASSIAFGMPCVRPV
jgi:hypothetical protein